MSLPDSGRLVLQGHSLPGDPTQANPKKTAIILRMSAETFAALERDTKMEIDLTGQPKLHIGDTYFTMRPSDIGDISEELYVRMIQANKAGAAPLKLQGNIVGRLTVERELGEQVEKGIRERSYQAEKSKHERKTQLLEEIPKHLSTTKSSQKKTKPTKPTKSTPAGRAPPDPHRSVSASLQASRVASPRPSPRPSSNSTRARMIHCVALKPRSTEEMMVLVAGVDAGVRREVEDLVPDVLEKIPTQKNGTDPDAGKWRLKTESWLEVRPYHWPRLKPEESASLARQARLAYGLLNIPESDPRWEHVQMRELSAASVRDDARTARPSPAPSPHIEPKKPMITKKTKLAESSVKRKVAEPIQAKDESVRPPKVEVQRVKEREPTPTIPPVATKPLAARREPGSGFRANSQSSTPPATASPIPAPQPLKKPSPIPKRETPSNSAGPSRPSSTMPPPQRKPPPRGRETSLAQDMKESSRAAHPDPDRDRKRPATRDEPNDRIRKRPRDATESEYSDRDSVTSMKKRRVEESSRGKERDRAREADRERERGRDREREKPKEKEKAQQGVQVKAEQRDLSLPKKPIARDVSPHMPSGRPKPNPRDREREREATPRLTARSPLPPHIRSPALPPRPAAHDRLASVASTNSAHSRHDDHSSRNGSTKGRHTPSFTSSEDESSESKSAEHKRRDATRRSSPPPRKADPRPRKLPDDAETLRDLWDHNYPDYIRKHKRHRRLHDQVKRALALSKDEEIEIDFELPSEGELRAVNEEAGAAHQDMVRIQTAYYRLTGERLDDSYDRR